MACIDIYYKSRLQAVLKLHCAGRLQSQLTLKPPQCEPRLRVVYKPGFPRVGNAVMAGVGIVDSWEVREITRGSFCLSFKGSGKRVDSWRTKDLF